MRTWAILLLVVALLLSAACGCSNKKTATMPGGGKVTVEETGKGEGKVTVEGKKGEQMTMETKKNPTVTEAELGVPIYPGAEQGESGSWSMSGKEGSGASSVYQFKTKDPYDKVFAFYKDKVKNPTQTMETTSEGKKTGLIQVASEGDKQLISVTVHEEDGETTIMVTRVKQG
jgi:hypothetical protein